jgi:hypothetical protein
MRTHGAPDFYFLHGACVFAHNDNFSRVDAPYIQFKLLLGPPLSSSTSGTAISIKEICCWRAPLRIAFIASGKNPF